MVVCKNIMELQLNSKFHENAKFLDFTKKRHYESVQRTFINDIDDAW